MRQEMSVRIEQEHAVRVLAARTVRAAAERGPVIRALANSLSRSRRCIRRWVQMLEAGSLVARPPGPRRRAVDRETRQGIIVVLVTLGQFANEHLIKRLFGEASFSVIRTMKQRFLRVSLRRRRRATGRLHWRGAGRVWAMDFTKPKAALPKGCKRLFLVRDLASGFRLASVPCAGERASVVIEALELLFELYGRPLVIKHDGGSAFRAGTTQDLLDRSDVYGQRSPAYTPEYNGSIERSLGWDKRRIQHLAELAGHPGKWTAENVEHARLQANATLRPRGLKGATPNECFAARKPLTAKEREAFKLTVHLKTQAQLETHIDEHGRITASVPFEVMQRRAVTRALVEHGYLKIRRGRISTPL